MSVLETVGLGSLVGFIAILSKPIMIVEKIPFDSIKFFLLELDEQTIILYASVLIILVFVIKNLIFYIIFYIESSITKNMTVDFSKRIFASFLKNSYMFHTLNSPVSLISTILPVTQRAIKYIFACLVFSREALTIIFLLGALIFIEDTRIYSVIFIFFGFMSYVFNYFSKRKFKKIGNKMNFHEQETLRSLDRAFSHIKLIKLFNSNDYWVKKFFIQKDRQHGYSMLSVLYNIIPKMVLEIIAVSTVIALFFFLITFGEKQIEDMLPILSFITLVIIRCIPAFNNLNVSLNSINYCEPSLNKVLEFLIIDKNKPKIISRLDGIKKISVQKIEVRNLTFSYNKDYEILKDLSFKISKGQMIGISGKTGTGKSTLVDLILGLLKPDRGHVLINDKEIDENSFKSIDVGYVTQDTYLSDDTIIENIAFGIDNKEINHDKVEEAIRNASLEEFINSLPNKGNTYVGEGGIRISGGQKQRIGLARALYNDPKILILDEATSALDYETEEKIINEITKLKKDKIIVMIAHRLNTLKNCDQIITIKDKKII